MKKMDFDGLASWCGGNGYGLTDWRPTLPSSSERAKIPVPGDPQSLTELIDTLVGLESAHGETVVWIADWTIWNDRSQEVGLRHLTLLVDCYVDRALHDESHIYLLEPSEWRETIALVTVPLLYGWDAYLFFRSGAALVEVSHDAYIEVSVAHGFPMSVLNGWL
ncbi:MAG: hypothetical protein AABO58_15540 [Acidobacteriota bacterium]